MIRDNGVPQQVDIVSFGEISLNVGLAFDLSSVKARPGAWTSTEPMCLRSAAPASLAVTFDRWYRCAAASVNRV